MDAEINPRNSKLKNWPKVVKREFSSGGIVARKNARGISILLIKDGYGRWTWPKGNIKKGESSRDTAVREIEEEVGIKDAKVLEKVGQTQYFYKLKGSLRFKTVYIYLCEVIGSDKLIIQKSEIKEGRWLTPKDALSLIEYKGSKEILHKAIERFAFIKKLPKKNLL